MDLLQFNHVSFRLAHHNGRRILAGLSFAIRGGENLTILGPSGSGKSTLLRLCNRLIDPTEGEIRLDGRSIAELDVIELRRRMGLVPQSPVFMRELSLRDNILFGPHCRRGASPGEDERLLEELLGQVGLQPAILEQRPEELSGGEAQRVCLARALALRPDILLMDEPTSSLDPAARLQIERLIQGLRRRRALTTLFVTHDLQQARRLGGRAAILAAGEIVEIGEIGELLKRPRSRQLFREVQ